MITLEHRSTIASTQNTSTPRVVRRQDYTGAQEHYCLYTEHFNTEGSKKTGLHWSTGALLLLHRTLQHRGQQEDRITLEHRSTIASTQNTSTQSVARRQDYTGAQEHYCFYTEHFNTEGSKKTGLHWSTGALLPLHRTLQHRVQQEDRITLEHRSTIASTQNTSTPRVARRQDYTGAQEHYCLYTEHFNTECSKKTGLHWSTGALLLLHRTLQHRVQQEDMITLEHRSTIASTQNTSTQSVARRQDYTGAQEHYCLYTEHFSAECSKKTGLHWSTGALLPLHRTLQRRVQQEDRITLEHRSTIASTQNTSAQSVARRQDYTGAQEHYCLYTEHFNTECSKKT